MEEGEDIPKAARRRYEREQLLAFSNISTSQQWGSVAAQLSPLVARELRALGLPGDDTLEGSRQRPRRRNPDRRPRSCKFILSSSLHQAPDSASDNGYEIISSTNLCDETNGHEEANEEEDYHEVANEEDFDTDSSEEICLQPLAFHVEGEPDFNSGPPQDGFEYLRRVKWEAAQCPKVKIAKIDSSKLVSEQTVYMPNIVPIPPCCPSLLPSKEWEKAFLADFTDLRKSLLNSPLPEHAIMKKLPPCRDVVAWKCFCFGRSNVSKVEKNVEEAEKSDGDEICSEILSESTLDNDDDDDNGGGISVTSVAHSPYLGVILSLDEVSRAALLRHHALWLECVERVSYDRALWIFSLTAIVDEPLDDSTSASMRALLRRCAYLRSRSKQGERELCMLNILITIAGKYFGQADAACSH